MHIVDHRSLKDDDVVARGCKLIKNSHSSKKIIQRTFIFLGFMGSPSVASERFQDGDQLKQGGIELGKYCGIRKFSATLW